MPDNPLFPGYIPRKDGDFNNPLFPGYAEGQRAYRPAPGTPLGKYEYNADYWLEQLDQMSIDTGNFPKWFLDRYVDDFKRNLRAMYSVENIPVEQMDDYDQDVMPGVTSVSLSLDPAEWKDPGKVVESTVKSWIKAGTGLKFNKEGWGLQPGLIDLSDYDNNVRTALWKAAFGVQEESDLSELGRIGGRSIAETTRAMAGDASGATGVFNFRPADYVVSGKNAYQEMAKSAVDVERYIKAGPKRDSKHDAFLGAFTEALSEELDGKIPEVDEQGAPKRDSSGKLIYQKITVTKKDKAGNDVKIKDSDGNYTVEKLEIDKTRKELFAELFEDPVERENFRRATAVFSARQDMASRMKLSNDLVFAKFGLKGFLDARISKHPEEKNRGEDIVPESGVTRFQDRLSNLKEGLQKSIGINELGVATGDGNIDKISNGLRGIDIKDLGLAAVADDLKKSGDAYKEYLQQVWEAFNKFEGKEIKNGVVKNVNKISERELLNILQNIKVKGKGLVGGDIITPSIHRDLLRKIDSDVTLPGKFGKVEKRLQIGAYLPKLESLTATERDNDGDLKISKLFEENGLSPYKGFFGNQARMVASRLELDRSSYAIEEFYDAVTQGKFMERFVWNRISTKLVGYTPGELLKNGLTKVGYFGLNIDDDHVSNKLRNNVLFNSAFRYKFNIKLEEYGEKAKFVGDKRLAFIETHSIFLANLKNNLSAQDLADLLSGKVDLFDAKGNILQRFRDKVPGMWVQDTYQGRYIQGQLVKFRSWLSEVKPFGIDIDHMKEGDEDKLLALFKALGKENSFYGTLGITTEYAGAIQRLGMALNKLQKKIFGSDIFKKAVLPVLQLKTIIAERVSKFTADVLAALATKGIHVLTGGATTIFDKLIEKILKPLIRFMTRKAVEFAQNFVGALAQGDISRAMAQVDKEIAQVVKFSMYVIGIPLIFIYILVYGLFGTVLNSISPIDPTRDNMGYGGNLAGGALPQGENALIKIEKDLQVFAKGSQVVSDINPISVPNDAVGFTLKYTIKVTAKVDIADTPIVITDTLTRLADGEVPVPGYETPTQIEIAPSYVAGVTTEYVFEVNNLDGEFARDSLIKNELSATTPEFEGTPEDTVVYTRYLRVGTPKIPLDCFVFENIPANEMPYFENAVILIAQKTGPFLANLCAGAGTVKIQRVVANDWGWAYCPNRITFGNAGVAYGYYTTQSKLNYFLAHELGHIWECTFGLPPGFYDVFNSREGALPTYDMVETCGINTNISEDFAETIGDFMTINTFGGCHGGGAPSDYDAFWRLYPAHYRFMNEILLQ